MKKILFRKLLSDCLVFFLIALTSTSVIIWIFQAVNFLDIMVEDGRDYIVYINYSLLSFPKIISKIIPFTIFFSFYYIIDKYEINNELMIFWNFGVEKIQLANFLIFFSIFITILQLILTIYVVPETQNLSRSLIRTSNVDFIDSFVKPRKFNDNINGLTIYAEEKFKNGTLKNLYLKKSENNENFQITIAKKGEFKNLPDAQLLVLYNGQTINKVNNKITNFYFSKSDFNLNSLNTDIVTDNKIQETKTRDHIICINKYFNKDLTFNSKQINYINHNCSKDTLDNLFQELYKRFVTPLYIPILILTCLFLIIVPKENKLYKKSKYLIFITGIFIIILSEIISRFVTNNFINNLNILIVPITIFIIFYISLRIFIKKNIGAKT